MVAVTGKMKTTCRIIQSSFFHEIASPPQPPIAPPSSLLKMAAPSSPTALLPLPRTCARNGVVFPSSSIQPQLGHRLGLSSRARRTLEARGSVRASCIGDNNQAEIVTGKSWDELILKSDIPVLVEFYTSWCGPCRMVHRVIEEIAMEYSGRVKCFVLNADHDPNIADDYDVKAVPVVLMFTKGEKCNSIVGTMPKEFYVAAIQSLLPSS